MWNQEKNMKDQMIWFEPKQMRKNLETISFNEKVRHFYTFIFYLIFFNKFKSK